MNFRIIQEPDLEFGKDSHICPKNGISRFNVYDTKFVVRRDKLLIGAVGTSDNLEKLSIWLDKCAKPIPPKLDSNHPNLFSGFCGFSKDYGYKSTMECHDEITRSIKNSDIRNILKIKNWDEMVQAAVELYYRHVKFLTQNKVVDVVACIIPTKLYEKLSTIETATVEENIEPLEENNLEMNFRRYLKAKCLHLGKPLQLMRELSLEPNPKGQQDDATKAWNFCTAIYYKANNTVPWRLKNNANRLSVCYVGIGFYKSRDKKVLNTSLAQVFDDLGNSVILRGTPVNIDKDDRRPHLTENQAFTLLKSALNEYEIALENNPARIVIHKSSKYYDDELNGFKEAAKNMRVNNIDFVSIHDTSLRLLRDGEYPVYRGAHLQLTKTQNILYTRGSVSFYKTYTGLYIPQPLEVRIVESDESPNVICEEILSLTKMNWNNTQIDGKYPITIQCARKVGQILKYLNPDDKPQISYSYYM